MLSLLLAGALPACADSAAGDDAAGVGGSNDSADDAEDSSVSGAGGGDDSGGFASSAGDELGERPGDSTPAPTAADGSAATSGGGSSSPATSSTSGGSSSPATSSTSGGSSSPATSSTSGGSSSPATSNTSGGSSSPATSSTSGGSSSPATSSTSGGSSSPATSNTSGGSSSPATSNTSGGSSSPSLSIFVAQGDMGRSIVSCDDGRTWVANQSNDDSARCGGGTDCDHGPGAARGITHGDGYFYANFGWGAGGSVWRSRNGSDWESVLSTDRSAGGVAFGDGRLVVTSRDPKYSDDQGTSWSDAGPSGVSLWNVRHGNFLPYAEGRFIMAAEDGGSTEVVLSNEGRTWWQPDSIPGECGAGVARQGGTAYGNGNIVMVGSNGVACRSGDGGKTWSSTKFTDSVNSQVVWNGQAFMVWSSDTLFRSPNGQSWTETRTSPAGLKLGPVAVSDKGTFIGANAGWNTAYENQRFYRSVDGVSWETLPSSAFMGSHPIQFMAFGKAPPGTSCPKR